MAVKSPTPGPPLPHIGPKSVPVFTVRRPVWTGKRKEFLEELPFYETLPMPGEKCGHDRKQGREWILFQIESLIQLVKATQDGWSQYSSSVYVQAFSVPWKRLLKQKLREN